MDRIAVQDANSLRAYDFPQGKEKEVPHTTARQQRQAEQKEGIPLHRAHHSQSAGDPPPGPSQHQRHQSN